MKQSKSYLNIILTSAESIVDHSFILKLLWQKLDVRLKTPLTLENMCTNSSLISCSTQSTHTQWKLQIIINAIPREMNLFITKLDWDTWELTANLFVIIWTLVCIFSESTAVWMQTMAAMSQWNNQVVDAQVVFPKTATIQDKTCKKIVTLSSSIKADSHFSTVSYHPLANVI